MLKNMFVDFISVKHNGGGSELHMEVVSNLCDGGFWLGGQKISLYTTSWWVGICSLSFIGIFLEIYSVVTNKWDLTFIKD